MKPFIFATLTLTLACLVLPTSAFVLDLSPLHTAFQGLRSVFRTLFSWLTAFRGWVLHFSGQNRNDPYFQRRPPTPTPTPPPEIVKITKEPFNITLRHDRKTIWGGSELICCKGESAECVGHVPEEAICTITGGLNGHWDCDIKLKNPLLKVDRVRSSWNSPSDNADAYYKGSCSFVYTLKYASLALSPTPQSPEPTSTNFDCQKFMTELGRSLSIR